MAPDAVLSLMLYSVEEKYGSWRKSKASEKGEQKEERWNTGNTQQTTSSR